VAETVWNIPFNGLAIAAGGVTTDRLLADPETEARIRRLMAEVIAAARALSHEIEDSVIDFEIDRTRPMGAYRPSSMIDFVDGRPVEYEAIWAEPLRRARESGVAVPELEALAAEIREKLVGS
jgi:2-dehydropantoate 2-reductase